MYSFLVFMSEAKHLF